VIDKLVYNLKYLDKVTGTVSMAGRMQAPKMSPVLLLILSLLGFFIVNGVFFLLCMKQPSFLWIRMAYNFMTIFSPLVWLSLGIFGLLSMKRFPMRKHDIAVIVLFFLMAIGGLGIRVQATLIEPNLLLLREVTITSNKVTNPWKILHITDFQSDIIGGYEKRAIRKINELNTDLVLFTGDMIQPNDHSSFLSEFETLNSLFETIQPPGGFLGVYGDVDDGIRIQGIDQIGNMELLQNQDVFVRKGGDSIHLLGLSCHYSKLRGDTRLKIEEMMQNTNPDAFTVIIGHSPDFILEARDFPIDLCLAGHTHGGQVRIPFWGPPLTLSKIPRDWARGFRKIGKTCLNVSAGIGSERADGLPAIRFNCPSEMTLITILPS